MGSFRAVDPGAGADRAGGARRSSRCQSLPLRISIRPTPLPKILLSVPMVLLPRSSNASTNRWRASSARCLTFLFQCDLSRVAVGNAGLDSRSQKELVFRFRVGRGLVGLVPGEKLAYPRAAVPGIQVLDKTPELVRLDAIAHIGVVGQPSETVVLQDAAQRQVVVVDGEGGGERDHHRGSALPGVDPELGELAVVHSSQRLVALRELPQPLLKIEIGGRALAQPVE